MFRRVASDRGTLHRQLSPRHYMPDGFPTVAITGGVVERAERVSKGDYVRINHGKNLKSHYMHLRNLRVRPGDRIREGQTLGEISFSPIGYTLNHLHFETEQNGRRVNPERVLAGAGVAAAPLPPWLKWGLVAGAGILAYRMLS